MKSTSSSCFLVLVILVLQYGSFAQLNTAGVGTLISSSSPEAQDLAIEDRLNDYLTDGIPVFSAFSGLEPDAAASSAAEAIERYDDESWSALLGALRKAGFTIIDRERRILISPDGPRGNGLAIYDWETAGMLKLSRRGFGTTVLDWMSKGATQAPELDANQLAVALLADLRRQAQNASDPQKRFWARLIIELGKSGETPVDLMTASPSAARIDAVQLGIWERRLTGDILGYLAGNRIETLNGSFRWYFQHTAYVTHTSFRSVAPCELNNEQGLIVDAAANGLGAAHGEFMGLLEKGFGAGSKGAEAVGKIGAGLGAINLALVWAKLVAAHMVIKGEATVEEPLPLVRTVNSTPGQRRLMKARLWADVGDLQYLNCVRTAVNVATGLDFSLPSDGPLADRDVAWELTGAASFAGQGSSKTGVFKPFVNLEAPQGAKRNFDEQVTDANGETKMYIVGAPKIPAVAYFKAVKVKKVAPVRVSVALKSPRDIAQNLIDIGGATLGVAIGGPMGILSALPELGFRMKRPVVSLKVPVEDREPCEENWIGTIEFQKRTRKTERNEGGTRTKEEFESVEYYISGKQPSKRPKSAEEDETTAELNDGVWEMMVETSSIVEATAQVVIRYREKFEGIFAPDPCCGPDTPGGGRGTETKETTGDLLRNVFVMFVFDGQNIHFNLEPAFSNLLFDGIERNSRSLPESKCPYERSGDGEVTNLVKISPLIGQNLLMSPQSKIVGGVETISGSKTTPIENGEITVRWELSRCG